MPAAASPSRIASDTAKAFSDLATTRAASAASTTGPRTSLAVAHPFGGRSAESHDHRSQCGASLVDVVGLQRVARPFDDRRLELEDRGHRTVGISVVECLIECGFVELGSVDEGVRGGFVTCICGAHTGVRGQTEVCLCGG